MLRILISLLMLAIVIAPVSIGLAAAGDGVQPTCFDQYATIDVIIGNAKTNQIEGEGGSDRLCGGGRDTIGTRLSSIFDPLLRHFLAPTGDASARRRPWPRRPHRSRRGRRVRLPEEGQGVRTGPAMLLRPLRWTEGEEVPAGAEPVRLHLPH
jgi:hypothetical protein